MLQGLPICTWENSTVNNMERQRKLVETGWRQQSGTCLWYDACRMYLPRRGLSFNKWSCKKPRLRVGRPVCPRRRLCSLRVGLVMGGPEDPCVRQLPSSPGFQWLTISHLFAWMQPILKYNMLLKYLSLAGLSYFSRAPGVYRRRYDWDINEILWKHFKYISDCIYSELFTINKKAKGHEYQNWVICTQFVSFLFEGKIYIFLSFYF